MKCLLSLLILINWYIIQVSGILEWIVIGKVTEYGQDVTLFCNVSHCCPNDAGWDRWTPQQRTLFIDLKTGRRNKKYDGKIYRDGYTLIIKNLTEKDLNVSYSCLYGVTLGERKFLLEEDVFTYISTERPNVSTANRTFEGELIGIIVGVIVLLAVAVVCIYLYCWRHRNINTEGQVANSFSSRVEYEKRQVGNKAVSVVISDDDLDKNTGENTPLISQIANKADSVVESDDDLNKNTSENSLLIGQIANEADSVVISDDDLDKNTGENTPLIEITNDLKSMDSKEQGVFMKEIKFRKQIRRYVRVQVIGKNAVGKTSLVCRLLGKNLQDVHSTDGIDITKTCRISTKDGKWSVGEGGTERQETIWRLIQILKMKAEEQKELSSKEKKNESKVMPPIKDNNERNVNAVPKHDETSNDLTNDNNLNNPDGTIKLKKVEPIMENPKSDVNISEQMSLSDENQESKISNEKMKEVIDEMGQIIALVQQQEAAMAYDGLVECGIWDFAGEKDYYVTHQTFLTPHAIYLLVASLKDDKIEVNGENYDNIEEYIDFWFDSIHCFCGNSSDHENNLNPPVILVLTHTDEWLDPEEIAQQSGKKVMKKKEDYKQKIANIIGKKSDHIRGIFFLSNTQFGNEDINTIDQLKQLISNTAKEMEYFAETLPMEWIQLENALAVFKRDLNTNILSMDNISDLAIKAVGGGIDITAFLNHQHKIGNLIFFDDIKDYIILQPNWLVQCFRCLICDDKKYNENITLLPTTALTQLTETGNISKEIIAKLFKKESHLKFGQYQNHILRVLEKFDIIVKPSFKGTLNNECQKSNLYYMPCMISKTEALEIIKKKYANSFSASPWLTFEFEFLPLAFFNHILLYFLNDYIVCAEEDGEKRKAIYKGKAVFCLDDSGFERLILCFSKNAISLQIWKEGEVEEVIYKNILEKLNRKIEELNNQLRLKIIFTIKAKCSTGDYSKRAGRLSSEELDKKCRNGKYMCAEHEETHNKGEIWNTWLKHTLKSSKETNSMSPRLATPEDKEYIDYWFDRIHRSEDPSKDNPPIIVVIAQTDYGEQINGIKEAKKALPTTSKQEQNLNTVSEIGHDIGIKRQNNQSESTTHPITQIEAVHLDNLALPAYQISDNLRSQHYLRSQQTLISSQSISEDGPQPPVITSDTSLPLAVNTVYDLNIEHNNQNVRYENNHCLSSGFNNLGTATGQSKNDLTVTGSFVNNTRTESLSEYDKMTSCSDNLLVSMDDKSNTYNDIDTHVGLPVINSRSDLNPKFQMAVRMTSVPITDAEPCTVSSITEKMKTVLDQDDEKDIIDAVILHAEDDRQLALEFIQNMEAEFPELELSFKLFEQLHIGKSILESAPLLFSSCRFVFVFVTKRFKQDNVSKYVSEMLLLNSITFEDKTSRLIPIVKDVYHDPVLAPLIPLKYNIYLEGKSQNKKDSLFLKTFERFVKHGRKYYLIS